MAQIIVDSTVMREKAKLIEDAAKRISTLYGDMLKEVQTTGGKMKGTTIETEVKQFASMQSSFETFTTDINEYATFLTQAAEEFEQVETDGTSRAQETGKIF